MDIYSGARIRLRLKDNDVLIGFINSINTNEEDSIVALSKTEIWKNGQSKNKTRLPGVQRIQASLIEELEILPETDANKVPDKQKNDRLRGRNVKHPKKIPGHLKALTELEQEKLVFGADKQKRKSAAGDEDLIKTVFQEEGRSSDYDSSSEVEDSYSTKEFTVLTKTDTLFHEAIKFIAERPTIGFAAEGIDIGREGKLCWIQIDAGGSVFLFDMLNLGTEGLKQGLKNILQSESILKVVHDCRLISDLLYHQFRIQMLNIFDTQVAHVLAYREQNRKDLPRYVPGLASCLYEHLDLPDEQIHIIRIREQAKSEDQEIWAERPAPRWLLDAAAKHVKHLLDLRMILMEKMMVEFKAGVEIYLTYVRNSSDKEAKECQSKRHLLPIAFQHLPNFVADLTRRMKYYYGQRKNRPKLKDRHGFTEENVSISDPKIIGSKDSIWHAKRQPKFRGSIKVPTIEKTEPISPVKVEKPKMEVDEEVICKPIPKPVKIPEKVPVTDKFRDSTSEDSESDSLENLENSEVTKLSDSAFMQQISSQAEMKPSQPSENIFSSLRRELGADTTNHLRGITLLPAGHYPDKRKNKRYEESYYDKLYANEGVPNGATSEENEEHDYGEIPTPQRLGRASRTLPVFTLSKEQSMSTSSLSTMDSSIDSPTPDHSIIKHHNSNVSLSTLQDSPKISESNHRIKEPPNLNELQRKLQYLRQRSDSSSSSVTSEDSTSRHQQLVEALKVQK